MGRFAQGGGIDPNIMAAIQARMQQGGGGPGGMPTPGAEGRPWAPPMGTGPTDAMEMPPAQLPQPRGRQNLSGATSAGIVGRGGNLQPLGAAAQRRMPPQAPPSGPISAPVPLTPDAGFRFDMPPQMDTPPGVGSPDNPQGPVYSATTNQPQVNPAIMDVIDRVRMNSAEQPIRPAGPQIMPPMQDKAGKRDIMDGKGGGRMGGAMRPPGPVGKPPMKPGGGIRPPGGVGGTGGGGGVRGGGIGGASLPGGGSTKLPQPPPGGGIEPVPIGKPPVPMPMQGAPEGPAFEDMLAKLKQQGGIGGTAVRPQRGRRFAMGELLPGQVAR